VHACESVRDNNLQPIYVRVNNLQLILPENERGVCAAVAPRTFCVDRCSFDRNVDVEKESLEFAVSNNDVSFFFTFVNRVAY
jgi:hypothetical protein